MNNLIAQLQALMQNGTGIAQRPFGWNLQNAWPKMITNGTKALSGSSLPAVIDAAGVPAVTGGAARAAGAALGGPVGAGLAMSLQSDPANGNEVPFYVIDPTTGKLVPNPAAAGNMPAGSFGFGGGYTPQPPAPSQTPPTDAFGSPQPTSINPPMPRPRPAAPLNLLQFASPNASGPTGTAPTTGPSLIQKFMDMLANSPTGQGASSSQLSGTPYGVTGSMF